MLRGDLSRTPLDAVLRMLADEDATGGLHLDDGLGAGAEVFLRGGRLHAVVVPGRRPPLDARLVPSGEQLLEAVAELLRWRTGTWRFRVNERTREDVAPPMAVDDLLAEIDHRAAGGDAVPVLVVDAPQPCVAAPDTDTAALLRELSFLGLDDDAPPPPAPSPPPAAPPRPVAAAPPSRRKGLFRPLGRPV